VAITSGLVRSEAREEIVDWLASSFDHGAIFEVFEAGKGMKRLSRYLNAKNERLYDMVGQGDGRHIEMQEADAGNSEMAGESAR
jgi:hypothetical protein